MYKRTPENALLDCINCKVKTQERIRVLKSKIMIISVCQGLFDKKEKKLLNKQAT